MTASFIIHIGYHKTATTTLQQHVFPRLDRVHYVSRRQTEAVLGPLLWSHELAYDAGSLQAHPSIQGWRTAADTVLISHEALVGNPFQGARTSALNARRLMSLFPQSRVLMTVRSQLSMADSLYRQYVQEGGVLRPEEFFELAPPSPVYFDMVYLDYARLLDVYAGLFGEHRVCVLPHEWLAHDPERFFDELFRFMALDPVPDAVRWANGRLNVSVTDIGVSLARELNRWLRSPQNPRPLVPPWLATAARARALLQGRVGTAVLRPWMGAARCTASLLPLSVEATIRANSIASNNRLAARSNLPLQELGYPM